MLVQLPQQPQPHGSSTSTRISLLLACLVVVAALQYPMLVSYFQRLSQATVSLSTAAIADSSSGGIDRGKLLAALAGMSRYRAKTSVTWKKKRAEYNKLPASQKLVRAPPSPFLLPFAHPHPSNRHDVGFNCKSSCLARR